jgi:3-methyl-2-oxobutanoate hydroxymethyltransferase
MTALPPSATVPDMSDVPTNKPDTPMPGIRTTLSLRRQKEQGRKIVSLTCYDYSTARLLDEAGVDLLLVGDSLAMTMLGHPDTLRITVDEMLHHVKAVSRGAQAALVAADMPFMSYQADHTDAVRNAGRFLQEGGARAVKIEGGSPRILRLVAHLTEIGIPVIGHLGFTPQSIHALGGYRVQGKTLEAARRLIMDARRLEQAGAFALVLEMVPREVAAFLSHRLSIPTIGIGAGQGCDGQILVVDDLLGRYNELTPRFARRYLHSTTLIRDAVRAYAEDIHTGRFPNEETEAFSFPADEDERPALERLLGAGWDAAAESRNTEPENALVYND